MLQAVQSVPSRRIPVATLGRELDHVSLDGAVRKHGASGEDETRLATRFHRGYLILYPLVAPEDTDRRGWNEKTPPLPRAFSLPREVTNGLAKRWIRCAR